MNICQICNLLRLPQNNSEPRPALAASTKTKPSRQTFPQVTPTALASQAKTPMLSPGSPRAFPLPRVLLALAFPLVLLSPSVVRGDGGTENFCGLNWGDAQQNCHKECPEGEDAECTELGESYGCFFYTGCTATPVDDEDEFFNDIEDDQGDEETSSANLNNFCGETW